MIKTIYKYLRFYGGKYKCIVCGKRVRTYFPFSKDLERDAKMSGFAYDFKRMETLNHDKCNCPFCLSSDRERLYMIYLQDFLTSKTGITILDFAPNASFAASLKGNLKVKYTSADLLREDVDMKVDVCDMNNIKNNSYDFVICSHVLEHVSFPHKAVSEINRILNDDGSAIIMVPLFYDVKETQEDKDHVTSFERTKFYGQHDHVRLYARADFLSQLKDGGFKVKELTIADFDKNLVYENAIAENSVLYVVSKTKSFKTSRIGLS